MKLQTLIEATQAIEKQWLVGPGEPAADFEALLADMKQRLQPQLMEYLKHDMEFLIHALYRLDIREKDFHAAMEGHSLEEIAASLAEIILHRELEKAAWREKYRNR
jgi:hypothetical protein